MATSTALVTVEAFRQLTDPPGIRLELHNGEVVEVCRPKPKYWLLQQHLAELFNSIFGTSRGKAGTEFAFRSQPEHDLRVADVAWVSYLRLRKMDLDSDFGAPGIVVEVLSPSNRSAEMLEKKDLCFGAGCEEFWIVDPKRCVNEVTRAGASGVFYRRGDHIPVGGATCSVDEIFKPQMPPSESCSS